MKLKEANDDIRLDRIMGTKIAIYQSEKTFRFSLDAVLLARFVNNKEGCRILDLGSGNGVIPLILASQELKSKIFGIEINQALVELANKSALENGYQKDIKMIFGDIRNIENYFEYESFDIVISNPPYFTLNEGIISNNQNFAYARHEINGTIKDFISATRKVLKYRGRAYFVYNSARIVELLTEFRVNNLEPKRIKFVHSKLEKASNIFLVEVVKGAAAGLVVEPSLVVYKDLEYTKELLEFIKGDEK